MCDTDSVQICALLTVYRHVRYLQSAQVCVILTECRCMCDTYRVYRYVWYLQSVQICDTYRVYRHVWYLKSVQACVIQCTDMWYLKSVQAYVIQCVQVCVILTECTDMCTGVTLTLGHAVGCAAGAGQSGKGEEDWQWRRPAGEGWWVPVADESSQLHTGTWPTQTITGAFQSSVSKMGNCSPLIEVPILLQPASSSLLCTIDVLLFLLFSFTEACWFLFGRKSCV